MKYVLTAILCTSISIAANAQKFRVSYTSSVYKGPFTGNVILYLSVKNETPKNKTHWPCYRMQVKNIMPGQQVVFDNSCLSYPDLLSRIRRGDYFVQAVWDRNIGGRVIGLSTGNMYNTAVKVTLNAPDDTFTLVCDQVVPPPVFVNSRYVKEIKVRSDLLSRFRHRPEYISAAVILPAQYATETKRHFPLYFIVGGFGTTYIHYSKTESNDTLAAIPLDTVACIKIYLDGDCPLGHSTYANSDNNGPVGDAFAKEFLPELDKQYRTNGARLIRGHSSGGWTVAYLLTHYPKLFVAGNASAPDPVDFHSLMLTNLYTDNRRQEFVDALTIGGNPDLPAVYDHPNMARSIEQIIYRGEQNVSFDAVFGPRGSRGLPQPLFDPATGELNRKVFEHWKEYDLTQYVMKNWPVLKNDLDGKLRISVGTEDTEQCPAVRLMEREMKRIAADIEFAYYPGDHFTVSTPAYKKDQDAFLLRKYQEWLGLHNK